MIHINFLIVFMVVRAEVLEIICLSHEDIFENSVYSQSNYQILRATLLIK